MIGPGGDREDEPTVIGRRPVGPTKGTLRRGPQLGNAPSPAAAFAFEPAATAEQSFDQPPPRPSATAERWTAASSAAPITAEVGQALTVVPSNDRPAHPDDVLLAPAAPLLLLVSHLRSSVEHADVAALRKEIVGQLRRFEERAVEFGARANDISAARYTLCSLLDEAVMTTPWGGASGWSTNSLLLEFHSETWGGEKVFTILDRVKGEPDKYLALIKLIDVCILLGFEGRYRVIDNGRQQLDELREELARLLRQHGRQPPAELSTAWRGVSSRRTLRNYVPLWVVFALAGTAIISTYGLLKWQVGAALAPAETMLTDFAKPAR